MTRAFIDLHCHTSASFDSLAQAGGRRPGGRAPGLTHLVVTDHDRIDGALAAREAAPSGLTVIIGEEVKTADGDLICVFLERAIPPGLSAVDTIAAAREQGGLVGIPHPFDRMRGSLLKDARMASLARSSTGSRCTTRGSSARATSSRPSSPRSTACPVWPSPMPTRSSRSPSPTPRSTATRRRRHGLLAALAGRRARARPGHLRGPPVDAGRQGRPAAPRQRPDPAGGPGPAEDSR